MITYIKILRNYFFIYRKNSTLFSQHRFLKLVSIGEVTAAPIIDAALHNGRGTLLTNCLSQYEKKEQRN